MLRERFLPQRDSCRTLHVKHVLFTRLCLASFCDTNSSPTSLTGLHGPVSRGNLTSLGESGLKSPPGPSHSHSGLLGGGFNLDNVTNFPLGHWMEKNFLKNQQNNGKR